MRCFLVAHVQAGIVLLRLEKYLPSKLLGETFINMVSPKI